MAALDTDVGRCIIKELRVQEDSDIDFTAGMMREIVQKEYNKLAILSSEDKVGIIGVTYSPSKKIYDFFLNTNRIASERVSAFPVHEERLVSKLKEIAKSAYLLGA